MRRKPRDLSTEAKFQAEVVKLAKRAGWTVNHTYKAKLGDGTWRTTTTLRGMPDLFMFKPYHGTGYLEIKGPGGKAEPEQEAIVAALQTCPGVWAYIVWPSDWEDIVELLTAA